MEKTIEESCKKHKIANFYFDSENTDNFRTGYVCSYNDDLIVIAHISTRGLYDGFMLYKMQDLFQLETDDEYSKKIKRLYGLKKQKHPEFPTENNDPLRTLLTFAKEKNFIVSLCLEDSYVCGYVNDFDDVHICIDVIDDYGRADGSAEVAIIEVQRIYCDSYPEQDAKLLHEAGNRIGGITIKGTKTARKSRGRKRRNTRKS